MGTGGYPRQPPPVQASQQAGQSDGQRKREQRVRPIHFEQHLETGRVEMIPATSLQHQNKTINYLITKQQENGDNYRKRVVV